MAGDLHGTFKVEPFTRVGGAVYSRWKGGPAKAWRRIRSTKEHIMTHHVSAMLETYPKEVGNIDRQKLAECIQALSLIHI